MKRSYRLSREAKSDLLNAWKYLEENASAEIANEVIAKLYAGMDRLSKSPGIGHQRNDLTDLPVKFLHVRPYLIVYAPEERPLGIVRVLHTSRDIPTILSGKSG
jgi:antitoxin ParD1/3/4/toxin ParE1/3/4